MAIYLYDERRWLKDSPEEYTDFLQGVVTDLIVLVYGFRHGGVIGYKSELISSPVRHQDRLNRLIEVAHSKGIRVHAAYQVCRKNKNAKFRPHRSGSKFLDIHDPEFRSFIVDIMEEGARQGVNGICMDYIRTDDFSNPSRNEAHLEDIVGRAYQAIKRVNNQCLVSSTTSPYRDITHPKLRKSGRNAISWANKGYQDVLFDMKYGSLHGEAGDPPDMSLVYRARDLSRAPVIVMVSSYKIVDKKPVPTGSEKFASVLDAVFYEDDFAIYTGWLFSEDQASLVRQLNE